MSGVNILLTGGLLNHIETVTGDSGRDDVRATFVQPFLTYVTKTKRLEEREKSEVDLTQPSVSSG